MAWHHRVKHAAHKHAHGFVHKHPYLAAGLAVVGLVAVGEKILGKHATPAAPVTNTKVV